MKLVMSSPDYLKSSIEIISELVTEATFWVKKEGLELVAMDPGVVSMVILKIPPTAFSKFEVKEEASLSVNLSYLKQVLKRAKKSDVLTMTLTEDNKLKIDLESNSLRSFTIPLIDLEESQHNVPDLQFPITIQMSSDDFKTIIEDAAVVSDGVTFEANKDTFVIEAKGDLSSLKTELKNGQGITIVGDESVKATYSIEYLKKMIKGSKISSEVVIQFNTDYPLKLEYKEIDQIDLAFILAPRGNVE